MSTETIKLPPLKTLPECDFRTGPGGPIGSIPYWNNGSVVDYAVAYAREAIALNAPPAGEVPDWATYRQGLSDGLSESAERAGQCSSGTLHNDDTGRLGGEWLAYAAEDSGIKPEVREQTGSLNAQEGEPSIDATEVRAYRAVDQVLDLLVAAGHITREKGFQCRDIWEKFMAEAGPSPIAKEATAPQAQPSPEVKS